jgi:hypothetical protein
MRKTKSQSQQWTLTINERSAAISRPDWLTIHHFETLCFNMKGKVKLTAHNGLEVFLNTLGDNVGNTIEVSCPALRYEGYIKHANLEELLLALLREAIELVDAGTITLSKALT